MSSDLEQAKQIHQHALALRAEIGRVVVGQTEIIEHLLMVLLCGGHCLLIGVPGLAKTTLVRIFAQALDLSFKRVQFTPDLMPADITGTEVIETNRSTGEREFRFVPGPLFANIVLADEINRTPPKTQAALLEGMQEHRVTSGGINHALPEPFFVLATQNPIEQEGTYPLPEAQLDRFLFSLVVNYPSEDHEVAMVTQTTAATQIEVNKLLNAEQVLAFQDLVRKVPIAENIVRYAVRLAIASRPQANVEGKLNEYVQRYVAWGAGPRASQTMVLAGKARAILQGRMSVSFEDIRTVAGPAMRHRIVPSYRAEAEGISADAIIQELVLAIKDE